MTISRRLRDALLVLLLAGAPASAANLAQFLSLNCLHLGWNGPALKDARITAELARAPNFEAIYLQEVMNNAGADIAAINPYPAPYIAQSILLGHSTYKETYVILIPTAFAATTDEQTYPDAGGDFSRNPHGAFITTAVGNKDIWLVDYHAVFGRRKADRVAEVTEIPNVSAWFFAQRNATQIFAGDWNLRGDVAPISGFGVPTQPANTTTSLKRNGDWSQAYDRFIIFDRATSNVDFTGAAACTVVTPINGRPDWRNNASDHVPVYCDFNY